jgi:hypothetical protein
MLRLSDARNFGRTLTGLLLIAGPLLMLAAQAVAPDTDNDDKLKELASIAAHKGTYVTSGVAFLLGGVCLMGAAIGVIRLFRGRRVGLGQIAGALLVLGGAATVAFYTYGVIEYEMATQPGIDRAAMAQLLHKADTTPAQLPIMIMFVLGIVVGLALLGIAAWRRGIVPKWAAVAILISGPIAFLNSGKATGIASFLILAAGLGALGLAALRMTDEQWDAPREAPAPSPLTTAPQPSPVV